MHGTNPVENGKYIVYKAAVFLEVNAISASFFPRLFLCNKSRVEYIKDVMCV